MPESLEPDPLLTAADSPPPSDPTPVDPPSAGGGSEPGAPPAPTGAPPAPSAVMERLRQAGMDPSAFQDEGQAVDYLLQSIHNYPQLEQMAQYGNLYLQHQNEFQQYLASRNQPGPQAPHQDVPQKPKWQPKEYDPRWEQLLTRDEKGNIVPISAHIDPTLPQKYAEYKLWEKEQTASFLKDPRGFIKQHLEEDFAEVQKQAYEKAIADFKQALALEQSRQQGNQLLSQHSAWMYQRDAQGSVLVDQRGFPVLTEPGRQYANAVHFAQQSGVSDIARQHQIALGMVAPYLQGTNGQAKTPGAPDPNQQRRDRFANAGFAPQANGTALHQALDPHHAQNERLSFMQMAEQEMRAKGLESLIPQRD